MLEQIIDSFDAFIFDLDNTIYDEKLYLYQAYSKIAEYISKKYNLDKTLIFNFLKNTFEKKGREKLFDKLIEKFDLNKHVLNNMTNILRTFECEEIKMFKEIKKFLNILRLKEKKCFILTNGNTIQQKNKIKCINFQNIKDCIKIYYANEIAPKPDPAGALLIIKQNNLEKGKTLFIGDSSVDEQCATKAGIKFINISNLKNMLK